MRQRKKHSYDTQSIQKRILPILQTFHDVCTAHNLTYYLWAGTQLGAVRHQGFIPWDDDADVAMSRKDYQILMEHAHEWFPEPFEVATLETTENYPHYFARLQDNSTTIVIRKHLHYAEGLHIDIFPLDNVPDSKLMRRLHFKRLNINHKLLYFSSRSPHKDNRRSKVILYTLLQKFLCRQTLLRKIDKLMQRYNKKETLNCTDSFYRAKKYVPYSVLGTPVKYNFEGCEFYGVQNADEYLSKKYGDYMTIPSEENQIQHSVDYLDLNTSFKQFDIKELE